MSTIVAQAVILALEFLGKVTVQVTEPVNSNEFFQTREGILVEDGLNDLFVGDTVHSVGIVELSKYGIKKNSLDRNIRRELPENHVFEADEFCQIITTQINKQWGGKQGDLLNNGYANIFYVRSKDKKKVFTVGVYWRSDDLEWRVYFWELDDDQWPAESCVFSRN